MDALQFAYWLRGFFEINGETALTKEQAEIISKHLTLVFEQKAKDLPPISQPFTMPGTVPTNWPLMPGYEIICSSEGTTTSDTVSTLVDEYHEALDKVRGLGTAPGPTTVSCLTPGRYC